METYISKSLEFGEPPVKDNTEPSLESNLLEGVTTIEPSLALRLGETLEVAVSRAVNSSNAPMQRGITTVQLQEAYDLGLKLSRKVFKTSSPAIALCKLLGLDFTREEVQKVREFLYSQRVQLRIGDKQCADPTTKAKKSKAQFIIRNTEDAEKAKRRSSKMAKSRWEDKSQAELEEIQSKQTKSVKATVSVQMADKDTWETDQAEKQRRSAVARAAMTEEEKQKGVEKWIDVYWSKSDTERKLINEKRSSGLNSMFRKHGILFHSTYECNMWEFLKACDIEYRYHDLICNLNGYSWHTDFYLPQLNMIIETKGKHPKNVEYWDTITLPKIKEANLCESYDIRLIWDRTLKKYSSFDEMLKGCERVSDIVCTLQ